MRSFILLPIKIWYSAVTVKAAVAMLAPSGFARPNFPFAIIIPSVRITTARSVPLAMYVRKKTKLRNATVGQVIKRARL